MKKFLFVLLIAGLTLSACASATPANTSPAPAVNTQAAAPATVAPAANTASASTAVSAATAAPKKISTVFTPSNPKSVNLAAGKPQLVEFFAFW